MSLFDNARSVVMNNKVVRSIKTTDGGVIYEKTKDTYLTIDVPLSLIYSDAFNITGALTDIDSNGLSGKSVDLLVGSTVVDSTTTTTNGAYSFTSTPVRTGNHDFKVVFNGDNSYESSESVTVSRVVGKETSVIINQTDMSKLGFQSIDGNYYENRELILKLVTDDNEIISNADVYFGIAKKVTDENGVARGVVSSPVNQTFSYNGDDNYSSSSLGITLVRQIPTVIQVTGDSVIQKEESTTLTVTVLDQDGDVIPNCTLSYSAKHGSTDVASGTLSRTNNNGQATVSYTGTGIGDVDFTFTYNAQGTLLQETYEVEDCVFYDPLTSNSGKWTIPSGVSFGYNEYSSDGWKIGNASSFVFLDPNVSLTLPSRVSFKLIDRYNYTPQLNVGNDYVEFNDTHLNIDETNLYANISNNKEYSFIIRSDSIEAYQDDTYLGKANISISQTNLRLFVGNNRYFKIKDFKVKDL